MKFLRTVLFLLITLSSPSAFPQTALHDFKRITQNPEFQGQLKSLARSAFQSYLGRLSSIPQTSIPSISLPLFATLQDETGETRGCMGSLSSQRENLSEEIRHKIILALTQDPWHSRVPAKDLPRLRVFLTAIGEKQKVESIRQISPAHDGVFLRSGSKGAVLLPGETKTQRYMLFKLRAKAGLRKNEPYEIYRLKTETIEIKDFWK